MDVPNGVTIPGVTQIRLRINPEGESSKSLEMPVDDVFFEGSRFYAFVPASHLQSHRRFHVQVALVVDSQIGPFSPERVTDLQYIGKKSFYYNIILKWNLDKEKFRGIN